MIAKAFSLSVPHLRALAVTLFMSVIAQSAVAFPPNYDGVLDPSFGDSYPGYTIIDFGNGSNGHQDGAHRLLRQPDGKFVAVGSVDNGAGTTVIGLARILNNGQIDTTFGGAGTGRFKTGGGFYNKTGNGIALLPSGQIVVAGTMFYAPPTRGQIFFPINNAPNDTETYIQWIDGSAFNDVLALPDGRLLVGGAAPGASSTGDFALVLYDGAGSFIESLTVPFDRGGSNNDQVQRISFVPSADAASQRLGYVYAIGSVALPNYPAHSPYPAHADIECGIIKAGLYSTGSKLRLELSFGASGKLVLNPNAAWSAGESGAIEGNAYCRGISVRKDGGLLIAGERYYFGEDNSHTTADDSMGFAAKLDANGVVDPTFHNYGSLGNYGGGFAFYLHYIESGSGGYEGLWFSLIQGNGLPLFGGLALVGCPGDSYPETRSEILRTTASGSEDATYSSYSCSAPRPTLDTGFDVALDGVFDGGRVVTIGNVFSSINPGSATDFVFMRHYSDRIFTDNFDPGY